MHNRCPRAPLPRKPMPDHRWPLHKLIPNAGSVALLVARLRLLLLVGRPPLLAPLGTPTLLLPVGGSGNGLPLPAPKSAAICASRTSTPCAVMGSWSRVRNERRSPLTLSPARCGAFSFWEPIFAFDATVGLHQRPDPPYPIDGPELGHDAQSCGKQCVMTKLIRANAHLFSQFENSIGHISWCSGPVRGSRRAGTSQASEVEPSSPSPHCLAAERAKCGCPVPRWLAVD
jgi:hypothetical protein